MSTVLKPAMAQNGPQATTQCHNRYALNVPASSSIPNPTTSFSGSTETINLPTSHSISLEKIQQSNAVQDTTTTTTTNNKSALPLLININEYQPSTQEDGDAATIQQTIGNETNKEEQPPDTNNQENHSNEETVTTTSAATVTAATTTAASITSLDESKESEEKELPKTDTVVNECTNEKVEADSAVNEPTSTSTPAKKEQNAATTLKSAINATRKVKPPKVEDVMQKVDSTISQKSSASSLRRSKRSRLSTQHFQYPGPEEETVSKVSRVRRNNNEKLIIFFNKEFLAVRNMEKSFFVCQAMQNIYKGSSRIRIRWLSQDQNDKTSELYTPDYYDQVDFDSILTNLKLERINKEKYKLPIKEQERTISILKRCLAVENGDETPGSLTEEHPDGIDLSLYKEESQLNKRKTVKRKAPTANSTPKPGSSKSYKSAKEEKIRPTTHTKSAGKEPVPSTSKVLESKRANNSSKGRSERAKRRNNISESDSSPVVDHKKAKVLAKISRKVISTKTSRKPLSRVSRHSLVSTTKHKVTASTSQATTKRARKTNK